MTAQPRSFDRLLADVLDDDGPQAMPADFVDGAVAGRSPLPSGGPASAHLMRGRGPSGASPCRASEELPWHEPSSSLP
jgi:hypothetical protein